MCSDIDGTLLNAKRDIAPETAQAVEKLPKDFPVILASSRMPSAMYYLQEKRQSHHQLQWRTCTG